MRIVKLKMIKNQEYTIKMMSQLKTFDKNPT